MTGVLTGHTILVVEDQPLIALDVAQSLEIAGAKVTTTNTLRHAMILIEHDGLSGAVVDHVLVDGDSSGLCARLKERGIPFLIHSGYVRVGGPCGDVPHVAKPATEQQLVTAVVRLIGEARPSHLQ